MTTRRTGSGQDPGSEPGPQPDPAPGSAPERDAGSAPERAPGSAPERDAGSGPERDAGSGPERDAVPRVVDRDLIGVLSAFDRQTRRDLTWAGSTTRVERVEVDGRLRVVRAVGEPGAGWSAVVWADLDDDPDPVIAEQVEFFATRGLDLEWKYYDYDRPADLPARLIRAGFERQEPETLVVARTDRLAELAQTHRMPDGVRLVRVQDETGLAQFGAVMALAFGESPDSPSLVRLQASLARELRENPDGVHLLLALAGDEPVSQGRIDFPPAGEFAGLWGGGTVPGWRGRGIYRALVAHRAALAAERGYRYLTVDASPDSRPILERLGFVPLAVTTPYLREPPYTSAPALHPDNGPGAGETGH